MIKLGKGDDPKKQDEIVSGLIGGLNTFQDETLLKDSELSEAKNIILDIDGIAPRPGTTVYNTTDAGGRIQGEIGYYKSDGTREHLIMCDGRLKKYNSGTGAFDNIGAKVWDTTADVEFVQARDNIYIFNGVDELSYYDGSTITTFTALTTPGAPTVTPTGTTGSTDYSYRISAINAVGETLASTATAITNGTSSLSATNYNSISWSAVSGATQYNVYGRFATGFTESYMATVSDGVTYNDKGQDDPSLSILPPEGNTTEGVIGTAGIFGISRLFVFGDPDQPSRLYYGGVGTNIHNFSGSTEGGGWVDVFRNDGAQIRAIRPFQGGVIVWKDNAIYKFSFTSVVLNEEQVQVPQLEEITHSFGGISQRGTLAVENDIIFPAKKDGRLAFYSLGNQENYAGSVLRTNELSIKVSEYLRDVDVSSLPQTASFYFNNIYGCAVTKSGAANNNRIWCLDTRFGAWVYWEGIKPGVFATYEDSSGNVNLYYGDDTDGYLYKMFQDARNDNGSAISVNFQTKAFNQKIFHKFKRYYNPTFQFKEVNRSGSISGEIYVDGAILSGGFSVNQQTSGGAGVGAELVGAYLPGGVYLGVESTTGISSDIVIEAHKVTTGRSIKYNFTSSTVNLYYKFLSLAHSYQLLPEKRLSQSQRYYVTG